MGNIQYKSSDWSSPKILVVDDAPVIQSLLKACLTCQGYQVDIACNGLEALQLIDQEMPDLILLDIMMPVMDGVQFASSFRERFQNSRTPIIVLSAIDDPIFRAQTIEAKFVFRKPFLIQELLQSIQHTLLELKAN